MHLLLQLLLVLLTLTFAASDAPPCPPASEIVYSPFTPWSAFYSGDRSYFCWTAAICTLAEADEARKQQFGATALVMGLLPLTLRDIAWPERRVVLVSAPLPSFAAVLVRMLGLEPMVKGEVAGWSEEDVQRWMAWKETSWVAGVGVVRSKGGATTRMRVLVAASLVALLVSYAALAIVELYSKASALGCTYPIFALTWCIVAVIPATVHTVFANRRRKALEKERMKTTGRVSAVQGVDEAWPVQFVWAVYYIAGTLVYTSIMAVTVLELFVWVVIQFAVTAASKLFALYICLLLRNPSSDDAATLVTSSSPFDHLPTDRHCRFTKLVSTSQLNQTQQASQD